MEQMAELAGFFAAHGVWCVSSGVVLTPILAFEMADGVRQMRRIVADELQDAVAQGQQWLAENPDAAARAVLVFDGYLTLVSGKMDALLVEAVEYASERIGFTIAVPFRPANSPHGFAVHRPKFLDYTGEEPDFEAVGSAFFRGVYSHEQAGEVWDKYLDESQ